MKKYRFSLQKHTGRTFKVKVVFLNAANTEQAIDMVKSQYNDGDISMFWYI